MEQNPSLETNQFSASQEIPRIFWKHKLYYLIHKCPPPVPIMSHIDPVHALKSHCLQIHLNLLGPEFYIYILAHPVYKM